MEFVASLFQGRTAAAQCGLFTHESVPVIFEPPCIICHVITLFKGIILQQYNRISSVLVLWPDYGAISRAGSSRLKTSRNSFCV